MKERQGEILRVRDSEEERGPFEREGGGGGRKVRERKWERQRE